MDISKTKMADLGTMMGGSPSSDAGPELAAGKVIGDRYEIIGILGRGGMGVVYEASDNLGQTQVALKFLRPELVSNDTAIQRFLNEARIVRDLSHPNIVRVYDVSRYENTYFLSMERLEGRSLRQLLEDLKARSEQMPVSQALSIAKDVTQALAYAHRTTIHRDLKPENVWVLPDGRAKLMDFGIARLQSQTQGLTKVASALGTAYYMAPEQLVGSGSMDARADQYALGVMLYEMLTGALPLGRSEAASIVRPGLPAKIDEVIDRLLGSKPEKRFITDEDVMKALDELPITEKRIQPANPKRSKQIAAALSGLALLGASVWGAMEWNHGVQQARIAAEAAAAEQAQLDAEVKAKAKAKADAEAAEASRMTVAVKAAEAERADSASKAKAAEKKRALNLEAKGLGNIERVDCYFEDSSGDIDNVVRTYTISARGNAEVLPGRYFLVDIHTNSKDFPRGKILEQTMECSAWASDNLKGSCTNPSSGQNKTSWISKIKVAISLRACQLCDTSDKTIYLRGIDARNFVLDVIATKPARCRPK